MHPRDLRISDFTYELPEDKIAQHPLKERDASRLLVYKNGNIEDSTFSNLPEFLPQNSLLIFNTTRVVRARLILHRDSGAAIEIFCTDASDLSADFSRILQSTESAEITAFTGNAKKWKDDEIISATHEGVKLNAVKIAPAGEQWKIQLSWEPAQLTFSEILDVFGKIPLPPYMHREEEAEDQDRYQTIFAQAKGSVAAPTASLHFTADVLDALEKRPVATRQVTLHVGAGTFKPVKSETIGGHEMHREQIIFTRETVDALIRFLSSGITAAGTTALRTLESIYWFGRQLVTEPGKYRHSLYVGQWEPYENGAEVPAPVALRAVSDWMKENDLEEAQGYTQILITPGYKFRVVTSLITNFHQPQSTLLLLVAAFTGEDYQRIYHHALNNNYRFLSYGDSSLLFRNQ